MFETEKVEKRISELAQKLGTDFLANEKIFQATINDILPDLKLERTVLINATSVHIGKILLAVQDLSGDEKRKAKNKAKDKLINEAAFSEEGADFVVTVLSSALGWAKVGMAKAGTIPPPKPVVSPKSYVLDGRRPIRINFHAAETPQQMTVEVQSQQQQGRTKQSVSTPISARAQKKQVHVPSLIMGTLSIVIFFSLLIEEGLSFPDSLIMVIWISGIILGVLGVFSANEAKKKYKSGTGCLFSFAGLIMCVLIIPMLLQNR